MIKYSLNFAKLERWANIQLGIPEKSRADISIINEQVITWLSKRIGNVSASEDKTTNKSEMYDQFWRCDSLDGKTNKFCVEMKYNNPPTGAATITLGIYSDPLSKTSQDEARGYILNAIRLLKELENEF